MMYSHTWSIGARKRQVVTNEYCAIGPLPLGLCGRPCPALRSANLAGSPSAPAPIKNTNGRPSLASRYNPHIWRCLRQRFQQFAPDRIELLVRDTQPEQIGLRRAVLLVQPVQEAGHRLGRGLQDAHHLLLADRVWRS